VRTGAVRFKHRFMQTVFKLLRHNEELGPFTIGELLQQQLTPDDLVWVDGESTAWAHPQEMDNLKYALPEGVVKTVSPAPAPAASIPEAPKVEPRRKPVSYRPSDEIERKAEELRQRTLAYKKTPGYYQPAAWSQTPSAPILAGAESDLDFHYHRKAGLPVGEVLMGAMVVGLLTLGWYGGGKDLFKAPREVASAVAVKMTATEENAAIGAAVAATDTTVVAINRTDSLPSTGSSLVAAPHTSGRKPTDTPRTTEQIVGQDEPIASLPAPAETVKKEEEKSLKTIQIPSESKESVKEETAPANKTEEATSSEPEKKKGLGHMLKGLFKKKKKGDDKTAEESKD
jgi:hypothetical protein